MSCMWRKMESVTPSYRTRDAANEQLSPMGHHWRHCGWVVDPPVMNGTSAGKVVRDAFTPCVLRLLSSLTRLSG